MFAFCTAIVHGQTGGGCWCYDNSQSHGQTGGRCACYDNARKIQ